MKKILFILLITCIMLSGCSKKQDENTLISEEEIANATWDCVEYDTLEKLNEIAGVSLAKVESAEVSNEWFGCISNSIAQYKFSINNEDWSFRACKDVNNDISGLYYDNITFESGISASYYNDEVYVNRFFYNDVQYVLVLTVVDKNIARSYFDKICAEVKTKITGVKSGYDIEVKEDGNDVIYRVTNYNDDGTTTIMEVIYTFKDDKMISIKNNNIFETKEAAKEYYDLLIENGTSPDKLILKGKIISSDNNDNLDFYSDQTKEAFLEQLKSSLEQ